MHKKPLTSEGLFVRENISYNQFNISSKDCIALSHDLLRRGRAKSLARISLEALCDAIDTTPISSCDETEPLIINDHPDARIDPDSWIASAFHDPSLAERRHFVNSAAKAQSAISILTPSSSRGKESVSNVRAT